jgi:hypothetical protein
LYQEAQLVFFSVNRFIIHDLRLSEPWDPDPCPNNPFDEVHPWDYPYGRLAASQFLREVIPTHCIAHLRFLELVFPPYFPATWPEANHPVMRDWRETVSWLRDKVNGPALTLRLVGVAAMEDTANFDGYIPAVEANVFHQACVNLLQPLKQLAEGPNGLARFYADLSYPWRSHQWPGEKAMDWIEDKKLALKRDAERRVMGDRYDSMYASGKAEPEQSLWQRAFDQVNRFPTLEEH